MKKIAIAILLAGLLLVAGCLERTFATSEVKIGWLGPLSGNAGWFGKANFRGVELAVDEINTAGGINGTPLLLIAEDTKANKSEAISAYQKLTKIDKVDVVLVPLFSDIMAVGPIAEQDKIVLLDTVDTSQEIADLGEYVFGFGIYDEGIGLTLAEYIYNSLGQNEAGVIYKSDDDFSAHVRRGLINNFEKLGGKITFDEPYSANASDFRAILQKLKYNSPDTVVVMGSDETGFLLRQSLEQNMAHNYIGLDYWSSVQFLDNAGSAAEGVLFTFWEPGDSPAAKGVMQAYRVKYNEEPSDFLFTATGYDTVEALASVMLKGSINGAGLKDSLYQLKNFNGLTGTITMSPDGIVRTVEEEMFMIKGREFHKLSDLKN